VCGIFGYVDRSAAPRAAAGALAARMRGALAHRGPDGWGVVTFEADAIEERATDRSTAHRPRHAHAPSLAAIGHQRLAIIDLSDGGRQPRLSPDGRFSITYNGEIYNYRELRAGLESAGWRATSQSDTEVLLSLFVRDGARCLDRLRGMFAFAVWDDLEGTLFMARDRFGIKPLCYTRPDPRSLAFASEPKALIAAGLASPEPAAGAAAAFLRRGSLPSDASWYRDVAVVPPGHWVRWSGDGPTTGAYWAVGAAPAQGVGERQADEVATVLEPAIAASVGAHMVSDVPVGVFLSGGLDSTAVLAAAREVHAGPLRTFTVAFPGTRLDESALAREVAARFETEHAEVRVSGADFFDHLDRFFRAMDEPTVDGANTFLVAGAAREAGLKVVLSGLGADELLGGYDSFVRVPRVRRLRRWVGRVPGGRAAASWTAGALPGRHAPKAAELVSGAACDLIEVWRDYRALFARAHLRAIVGAEPQPIAADRSESHDTFWDIARSEIEEFMSPQLLRDADAFTMTWGLELRTPFVDHLLVEAVRDDLRWPRDRRASFKATLFARMPRLVPPSHLGRPKQGFVLPIEAWLRRAIGDGGDRDETLAAVLARRRYRFAIDLFRRGRLHWSRVWALYVLERMTRGAASGTIGLEP